RNYDRSLGPESDRGVASRDLLINNIKYLIPDFFMELLPEYERLLQIARGKRKENKSFLDRLKKLRPKDLDVVTNEFHDKAFEKIDCLQCANCCKTTGPLLK